MRAFAIFLPLLILLFTLNANSTVIHVPSDSATIQAAINGASDGDTILVATGIYAENIDFGGKKIIVASMYLIVRDSTNLQQTIIDGGGSSVNKSAVSFLGSEDSSSILFGFTITHGYASGDHGGGITIRNGSRPSIQYCRIDSNLGAPGEFFGVGVQCVGSSPTFLRCRIRYNTAAANGNYDHLGGGLYIGSNSAPRFTECQISGNLIGYSVYYRNHGGGVYCDQSSPYFRYCKINENMADFGGGIEAVNSSNVTIAYTTFPGNSSRADGGAIASYSTSIVRVDTCAFFKNTAGGNGGALLAQGGQIAAVRSTITDNTASLGAGMYASTPTSVTVTDCIVFYNWWNEIYPTSALTQITYSDIRGGYPGTGNLDVDPLYCDWGTGMYTLASNSLCLTGGSTGGRMGYYATACGAVVPQTRRIPQDYATIQDAILHAYQGDTLMVDTGSYAENIQFWGRRVLLTSKYLFSRDTMDVDRTIIDGGGASANRSVVSLLGNEDSLSMVTGFTITNGYAEGEHGGGITIRNGSRPSIQYCRIVNNLGSPGQFYGIGVQCVGSSPTFIRCRIRYNTAPANGNYDHMGGGAYLGSGSEPRFTECQFTGNMIGYSVYYRNHGGGVYCDHSSPSFRNCKVSDNMADFGGGIEAVNSSNVHIAYTTFPGNSARADGGAVASYSTSMVQLDTCAFFRNTAGDNGGALLAQGGQITAVRSTVTDNTARLGAGIYASTPTSVIITESIVFYNWWNELYPASALTQITYSDIRGGCPGTGNLDIDPLFCDWVTGTYTLAGNSSCLTGGSGGGLIGYYGTACGAIAPQTRHIPQDYATIQEAIFHAYQGDTLMVDTGSYAENIQFWGRRVLLTSHYLTSRDTTDIDRTIIDGGGSSVNKSVVSFLGHEDSLSVLGGLTITNGYAEGGHGGGMTIANGSGPSIEHCRIVNNLGSPGQFYGIGVQCVASSPAFLRCRISNNTAAANGNYDHLGGGIYLGSNSEPRFAECEIRGNMIGYSVYYRNHGGAIYCDHSSPYLRNCAITGNQADYGGAIEAVNSSTIALRNCVVCLNTARANGGGFCIINSSPLMVNVTISKNTAGGNGGGMRSENSLVSVLNTIFWQDIAQTNPEISVSGNSPSVAYSDVAGGWTGTGNIDADPLFADLSTFCLSAASPCVDAGHPDSVYNDPEDTTRPGFALYPARGTTRSDIGAYGGLGATGWTLGVSEDGRDVARRIPNAFALLQNYPNPFNPSTRIDYELPVQSTVVLKVYNVLGQEIATLVSGTRPAGRATVIWDAAGHPSGVYIYRLHATGTSVTERSYVEVRKMMLVR